MKFVSRGPLIPAASISFFASATLYWKCFAPSPRPFPFGSSQYASYPPAMPMLFQRVSTSIEVA